MPRKAKEKIDKLNNKEEKVKEILENKDKVSKVSDKKSTKSTKSTTAKLAKNSVTKATKSSSKKSTSTESSKNSAKAKIGASKKTSSKNASKSRKSINTSTAKKAKKVSSIATEYYDLPFRYNQTIVRILAQTPNTLFIYWDISDKDRKSYIEKYGKEFFEATRPYLIITNKTMHYTFEVEINDFANSWYLHINDADCEYKVELGRKFIVNSNHDNSYIDSDATLASHEHLEPYHINDYIYITSSNEIETPNDHILFDKLNQNVFFRNIKTNVMEEKNISSLSFLQKIGKIYNIYDLYKEIYHDELINDEFGLDLPSSSSSTFK